MFCWNTLFNDNFNKWLKVNVVGNNYSTNFISSHQKITLIIEIKQRNCQQIIVRTQWLNRTNWDRNSYQKIIADSFKRNKWSRWMIKVGISTYLIIRVLFITIYKNWWSIDNIVNIRLHVSSCSDFSDSSISSRS